MFLGFRVYSGFEKFWVQGVTEICAKGPVVGLTLPAFLYTYLA